MAGWKPPAPWLRAVFKDEAFPPNTGLYFATLGKQKITRSLYVLPVLSESRDGSSSGILLRFWLRGLEICFVPPDPSAHIVLNGSIAISYRPDELSFAANNRTASVRLAWSGRKPGTNRVWLTPLVPT